MVFVRAAAAAVPLVVAALISSGPARAQAPFVSELKVGGLAHDVTLFGRHVESGADANIELLFNSPLLLSAIGSPRPHLGADINTDGNTSDVYTGLTWDWTLLHNVLMPGDGVFVAGSLGAALQDGYETSAPPGRKRLGFPLLFRESAELGYQVNAWVNVSAFVDHISNANLAPRNAGITSIGARTGFKF